MQKSIWKEFATVVVHENEKENRSAYHQKFPV